MRCSEIVRRWGRPLALLGCFAQIGCAVVDGLTGDDRPHPYGEQPDYLATSSYVDAIVGRLWPGDQHPVVGLVTADAVVERWGADGGTDSTTIWIASGATVLAATTVISSTSPAALERVAVLAQRPDGTLFVGIASIEAPTPTVCELGLTGDPNAARALEAVDLDNDGRDELVIGWYDQVNTQSLATVLSGEGIAAGEPCELGQNRFETPLGSDTVVDIAAVAVKPDGSDELLYLMRRGDNRHEVRSHHFNGALDATEVNAEAVPAGGTDWASALLAGHFDGDENGDYALASNGLHLMFWREDDGPGSFADQIDLWGSAPLGGAVQVDLGDGDVTFAVGVERNGAFIGLTALSRHPEPDERMLPLQHGHDISKIVAADLNGDGVDDLAALVTPPEGGGVNKDAAVFLSR